MVTVRDALSLSEIRQSTSS